MMDALAQLIRKIDIEVFQPCGLASHNPLQIRGFPLDDTLSPEGLKCILGGQFGTWPSGTALRPLS